MFGLDQVIVVFARVSIVVVGQDSERADYSNPRGEIYGGCAEIIAEAPDGARWALGNGKTFRWERDAVAWGEKHAERIDAAVRAGTKLDPRLWAEIDPCYGSHAYEVGGYEAERAACERAGDRAGF